MRVDFNVELAEDSLRLEASLPTIKFLLKNDARVILLSHRGRPLGRGPTQTLRRPTPTMLEKFSLRFAASFLESKLKTRVAFLSYEATDKILRKSAFSLRESAKIFLLENLRFWPEEEANDLNFARQLANLGDFYVNDAFAVSHRENASVTQLPKFLPAYAGLLMEEEISTLSEVMKNPKKPLVLIFGGAKVEDKLPVIKNLLPKADKILLGSSILNSQYFTLLKRDKKVIKPEDYAGEKDGALDIGPETVKKYKEEIKKAKTIIWNGPVGKFEDKKYATGSIAVAKVIARSKAFSIVGGGETTQLILELGLRKKIGFLSTGGGAMLEFLASKKLPGIAALE